MLSCLAQKRKRGMRITNQFLDQAIAGLERRDTWITSCERRELGLRPKDYSPVRMVKSWLRSIAPNIYSDIRLGPVVRILCDANWANVEVAKAKRFFSLFAPIVKDQHLDDGMDKVLPQVSQTIGKKIAEDTFKQKWRQRSDGSQIIESIPTSGVHVVVANQTFLVKTTTPHYVHVYNAHTNKKMAEIISYSDGSLSPTLIEAPGSYLLPVNVLEQILLGAHQKVLAQRRRTQEDLDLGGP